MAKQSNAGNSPTDAELNPNVDLTLDDAGVGNDSSDLFDDLDREVNGLILEDADNDGAEFTSEQETQDTPDPAPVDTSDHQHDYEKRYKDSSREARKLKDELDSLGIELGLAYMNTIPFQFEFGSQDAYMKVFGGMGYKLQNGHMVDYETNVGFDGMLAFGNPIIEQVGKHEFYAYNEDRVFEADGNRITMTGGKSDVFKLKPPRNQLSVGPFVGVQYDQTTGLTEPVIGFGLTYNMLKIWDWK